MLDPNIVTVVATIEPGHEGELECLLDKRIDTGEEGEDNKLPFSRLPSLHCCSFCIVAADEVEGAGEFGKTLRLPAYLVMEATFDGPADDFIIELVRTARAQLIEIFNHCVAFPREAERFERLIVEYLSRRTVAHNTYFTGIPGRSVAEVCAEDHLHQRIGDYVDWRLDRERGRPEGKDCRRYVDHDFLAHPQASIPLQSEYRSLQRDLRRMIRGSEDLRLLEEEPALPWAVRHGGTLLACIAIAVAVAAAAIGYGILRAFGLTFAATRDTVAGILTNGEAVAALVALWLAVRLLEAALTRHALAREQSFWTSIYGKVFAIVRVGVRYLVLAAGLIAVFDLVSEPDGLGWLNLVMISIGAVVAIVLLRFQRTTLRGQADFGNPDPDIEAWRRLWLDVVRFGLNVATLALLLLPLRIASVLAPAVVFERAADLVEILTSLAVLAAVPLALVALLVVIVFVAIRAKEHRDQSRFADAELLTTRSLGRKRIWDREEHRTNSNQNHFASVTYVKPGWLRQAVLRTALALINFSARYQDNQGTLGGIPTIISARWLLLDGGRRLLFLTNYVGAWDSYLGEFGNLSASTGVNAIWSNTYVRLDDDQKERFDSQKNVSFPRTRFLLWRGANLEQPFKAYVRQSQIRTLAWYGAYRHLSVPNINDNTHIRRALFRPLSLPQLEALFARI